MSLGPRGPRGIEGSQGRDGIPFNPVMNSLADDVAIVTDSTDPLPGEPGKYYRSFKSVSEALDVPSIQHIIIHRTQDDVVATINRSVTMTGIGTPITLRIGNINSGFNVKFKGLSLEFMNSSINSSVEFRDCNVTISDHVYITSAPMVSFHRCNVTISWSLTCRDTRVDIQSSKITVLNGVPIALTRTTHISFNNEYICQDPQAVQLVTIDVNGGNKVSISNALVRLLPTVSLFIALPLRDTASKASGTCITVLCDNPNLIVEGTVEAVSVNGKYSGSTYHKSNWNAYPIRTITSSTTLSPTDRTVIVNGSNINITIPDLVEGREYVFQVSSGTNRTITLANTGQVITLDGSASGYRLIIIGGVLKQLA
uniref:Uncharacterized protein n=1 Tax=viral metagenome TaxID=1070528 RepID=A0A6C0BK87_9ZZZZ